MKKICILLSSLALGWALSIPAWSQSHGHDHAGHAAAAGAVPCHVAPQLTHAAEMRPGGALYGAPAGGGHAEHNHAADMEGAHTVHTPQRGGAFFMAPNKTHHIEGVYTEECGFQLFLFNAFTQHIRVERFQAFVHVYPKSEDEIDIIRFLSPSNDGAMLSATFGDAVSRPFDIELYVRFPDSDEPQMFNIKVPAAMPDAGSGEVMVSGVRAGPNMLARPEPVYLTIANTGNSADRLLSAASPAFVMAELQSTWVRDDVTMMRPVEAIDLPANAAVELAPGGFRIMLFGARETFEPGDSFPLALTFEKAGRIETEVKVAGGGAVDAAHGESDLVSDGAHDHSSHVEGGHTGHGSN